MLETEHRYKNAVVKRNVPEQGKIHCVFTLLRKFGLTRNDLRFEKYTAQGCPTVFSTQTKDDATTSVSSFNHAISI